MEFLKDVLGEELYAQVAERLQGNEGIRLANIADGKFIPVDKFNAERANSKNLRSQLEELNGRLTQMQTEATASEVLKAQLAQLTQTIAQKDAEMKAVRMDAAILEAARNGKAKNPDIIAKLIDRTKITESDGTYAGLTEQIEAFKTANAYMFEAEQPQQGGFAGQQIPAGTSGGENSTMNNMIRQAAGLR